MNPSLSQNIENNEVTRNPAEQREVGNPAVQNQRAETNGMIKQIADQVQSDPYRGFLEQLPKLRNSGAINLSKLKKIGAGGTHDIYEYKGNQSYVIKIDRGVLDASIKMAGQLKEAMDGRAASYMKEKNDKNQALYDSFGIDNCLKERATRTKVGFRTLWGRKTVETVIIVQEKSDVFGKKDTIDLSTGYKGKVRYEIAKRAKSDLSFRRVLQEFLKAFKRYFETTHEFIDLIGSQNVMFYRAENGQWKYVIGSVVKGDSEDKYVKAYQKSEETKESLSKDEKNSLANGYAVTHFVNNLARVCNMEQIVQPVEDRTTFQKAV